METVALGATGIAVSRVAFGSDPIGGHGWGAVDDEAALDAIRRSIECGVTFFDTADCYGKGHSEELIGRAVRGIRDRIVVASKYGVRFADGGTYHDNSAEWLRQALDASLRRLRTDYIDLYQLHWWDGKTPLEEIAREMERAYKAGKIRAWGVTNMAIDPSFAGGLPPASFSYEYSLARREREPEILRTVERTGAAFLSWGSLGQGILTGKYGHGHAFAADDRRSRPAYVNFSDDGWARNLRTVEALRALQHRYPGRSIAQLALRWILDRVPGSIVLVGSKRAAQAADNASAMGWRLDVADLADLSAISSGERAA
jgi:aryl-alcohol dehydrogenase-like predicted oxidoreductase